MRASVELLWFLISNSKAVFFEMEQLFSNVQTLHPEVAVLVAAFMATLWNLFFPRAKEITPYICIAALIGAIVLFCQQWGPIGTSEVKLFLGLFTVDRLTIATGIVSAIVGIIVVLMTMGYERHIGSNRGEFYAILMVAILSVMLLGGSTDLIMLFVAMETLTLCCVMLSGFEKRDRKSNEAALKYLLSTAATTATFLYGLSFLYGITRSTNFYDIQPAFYGLAQSASLVLVAVLVLLISVVGFKLSMVPFHMWTPDVYEGSPTPVGAFLSIGSKLGGLVVGIRLLSVVFQQMSPDWSSVVGALAILSMIMGNIIALSQRSLKRMLAYSSIAHVGYMLIGLVVNTADGLQSMWFYIMVYGLMNLGAFTGAVLFQNETGTDDIDAMSGLVKKRPWLCLGLTICLLNLAGLPIPPAGFLSKFFVFWSGIQMASMLGYLMVGVALVTSVPAIYYYSRVCIKMIVRDPSEAVKALPDQRRPQPDPQEAPMLALAIAVAGIIAGSFLVTPLMNFAGSAVAPATIRPPSIGSVQSGTQPQ